MIRGQKMKRIILYILVFLSFLSGNAMSADQVCLTQYSQPDKLTLQRDIYTDDEMNAWVVDDNVNVHYCFDNHERIKKKIQLKSRFHIVQHNYNIENKDQRWSLLVKVDHMSRQNIIGWVAHENIITNKRPLRNISTGIMQKVLIKEGDRNQSKALQVFKSKKLIDTKEGIEARTVFYVYDFYPRTSLSPESKDTKSLLIGVMPQLNPITDNAVSLIGWVDRNKVSFWNSRTACEFPVGVKSIVYDDSRNILFETFANKPLNYNELRNPILKDMGNDYLIGAFMQLKREQLRLRTNIEDIRTGLEVLFVIDGTRSMTPAFKGTLKAVQSVANHLIDQSKKHQLSSPRFALVFYRDVPTRSPLQRINGNDVHIEVPYCKEEIKIFKMMNPKNFESTLNQQIACDSDRSLRESMYKGLIHGVQACGFLTGANKQPKCMRIIIHIGDAGDNGQGEYTEKHVSEAFREHHIFRYISIDVSGTSYQSQFLKDVENISFLDKGKTIHRKGFKGLSNVVKKMLNVYHKKTIELQSQIKIISKGFAGTSQGQTGIFSSELLNLAKKIIAANNIDLQSYNAFQKYVVGRIPKTSPIKKYLLVSHTDLEKISNFLTSLKEQPGELSKRRQVWESSLKLIIGDDACTENGEEISLEACNKKRNGIPIKAGFMKYTKSQFLNLSGNELRRISCDATIMREKFRAFPQDKCIKKVILKNDDTCEYELVYEWDINSDGIVNHSKDQNKMIDKYFFQEGGESMAWIPIEQLNLTIE